VATNRRHADKLVHDYFGVDLDLVWASSNAIPTVRASRSGPRTPHQPEPSRPLIPCCSAAEVHDIEEPKSSAALIDEGDPNNA
jgi:hypothetical protein